MISSAAQASNIVRRGPRGLSFFCPCSPSEAPILSGPNIADRAERLLAEPIAAAGYALLLCQWVGGTDGRKLLQVFIEQPDGGPVSIDDCVVVNNTISDLLDAEELVPGAWKLEVSSAGLDRPLKHPAHFAAQVGQRIRFRTWEPVAERRNWTGRLLAVDDDIITLESGGVEHRIPLPAIERANLVYEHPAKGQKKGGSRRRKRGSQG